MTGPWFATAAFVVVLAGCHASAQRAELESRLPEAEVLEGRRTRLRGDQAQASRALYAELERVAERLDGLWPWMARPEPWPAILLSSESSYRALLQERGVRGEPRAFVAAPESVLVLSGRLPEDLVGPAAAGDIAARTALPIYETAVLQRLAWRLEARPERQVERALAQAFALWYAASGAGLEAERSRRLLRDALAEEAITIWLGAPKGRLLAALDQAREVKPERVRGPEAQRWQAQERISAIGLGLFFLVPFEPLPAGLVERVALAPASEDKALRAALEELDGRYESFVRDRAASLALELLVMDPDPVERAVSDRILALLLGASTGLAAAPLEERRAAAAALQAELAKTAPPVRLLDSYSREIALVARSKHSRRHYDELLSHLQAVLKSREGYFCDALEQGRRQLTSAIERAVNEHLKNSKSPAPRG